MLSKNFTKSLMHGDLIFSKSLSEFSEGVCKSTGGNWSHIGIITTNKSNLYVLEATQPKVQENKLNKFLTKYRCGVIAICRLNGWSVQERNKLVLRARTHLNKKYDTWFNFADINKMYCSKLVFDAINFVRPAYIVSYPMDFKGAWQYWCNYYGNNTIPQGKPGISPNHLFDLCNLKVIYFSKTKLGTVSNLT